MKNRIAVVLVSLCLVATLLLEGCSPKTKSFSIQDPQKITITSLSGTKTEIIEEAVIRQITENISSIQFERGGSSKNTNGFGPFISWYDANGELIESISVMGDDTILYEDHFWRAADGSAEMEDIYTVLAAYNAYA